MLHKNPLNGGFFYTYKYVLRAAPQGWRAAKKLIGCLGD